MHRKLNECQLTKRVHKYNQHFGTRNSSRKLNAQNDLTLSRSQGKRDFLKSQKKRKVKEGLLNGKDREVLKERKHRLCYFESIFSLKG